MHIEKKGAALNGTWAKIGQDIKDGDRLKIMDAGVIDTSGNFGPRKVFTLMTTRKDQFILGMNQTSLNNLVDEFGEESNSWIGKVIKAWVIKQMVGDGLKNVCYFAAENWVMDDEGQFSNPDAAKIDYPKDDINPDDIPF